ncbi:methyl-accepting chemotaxis protein [Billgrantia desiderata]|uniref:methyl-accepting chemotaxis protein n=1 Tax=Billgrantia desiderata TaxID=52021 RepID=UPI001F485C76|nr:methyl-accepting chemotaxis protein [Halomonas desiderata]MCE8013278.1 HAMP domain-containing protein [Halomonas desiderata]
MTITIRARLIMFSIMFLAFLLLVSGFGLSGMNTSNRAIQAVYEDRLIPTIQLTRIDELMRENLIAMSQMVLNDPRLERDGEEARSFSDIQADIENNAEEIDVTWQAFTAHRLTDEERQLAEMFETRQGEFVATGLEPALEHYAAGDFAAGNRVYQQLTLPLFQAANDVAHELIDLQATVAQDEFSSALDYYVLERNLIIGAFLLALLISVSMSWWLIRAIGQPLKRMMEHFSLMAKGDLSQPIVTGAKDEVGLALRALADMQEQQRELIVSIQQSAGNIATGSGQIASGNTDLSQRTEEQASSLQETAASMEQVAATVKQNTEHAAQANQLTREVSQSAETGGEKADLVAGKMRELNESSEKISGIIEVIDGIAFQTNILALNASVEAARAGEQGRGFAVVAQEVRNLAQRCADAAQEIQSRVDQNAGIVKEGSLLVDEAGTAMDEIVAGVKRVSELMDAVARGSQEQNAAVEQVSVAVNQMDQVTQDNAALVEQTANASASLEQQARELSEAVASFKIHRQEPSQAAISGRIVAKSVATLTAPSAERHAPRPSQAKREPEAEWDSF